MSSHSLKAVPATCLPPVTDPRVLANFTRRFNTATEQAKLAPASHPTNSDLSLADFCGTYSKGLQQSAPGKVNLAEFHKFQHAISTGKFTDFELITPSPGQTAKLNGPMAAYASAFLGADASLFGAPAVPAPPGVGSQAYATELIELYWCSLLRDVAFTDYASNPIAAMAAAELSTQPLYAGPTSSGTTVTPELLFRGNFTGETFGPYLSQFLLTPTNFGSAPFAQKYLTYAPGIDYMTDELTWFLVQQGLPTGFQNIKQPNPEYLHDGRGLAAYTHVDELYQAYFTAYLAMKTLGVPPNPGVPPSPNPYLASKIQQPFGTFGGPDIAAVIAQVAKYALNACWYQKWVVHLRHRPEAAGGLMHFSQPPHNITYSAIPDAAAFSSKALQQSESKYGSYLLSQPFPEGSPTHPAYPTGHGAVGGACITVLKFFFAGDTVLSNPQMPTSDGTSLQPWSGQPGGGIVGPLTVNGELNKLAHNITFGHGLHGGIHWRSDSDASMQLGEAVALSFLQDLACSYAEPFKVTLTKLDGTTSSPISNL